MFIAAISVIAKVWKQPRYPSVDEWINQLRYNKTMECYLALKRNELSGFPGGEVVKNPPANAEDTGSSPGRGRSHMLRSG